MTGPLAPCADWRDAAYGKHFAQFFETDEALTATLGDFTADGIDCGEAVIVIVSESHRHSIERYCAARGIDLATAAGLGRYIALDARALLDLILTDDWPQAERFAEHIEPTIAGASACAPRVRAFGEMVSLLWAERRYAAAIRLEELWNELAERRALTIFCGYPLTAQMTAPRHALRRMYCEHALTVPAESYVALASPTDRLMEICDLQHRALMAESELAERKAAERLLAHREEELAEKVRQFGELDRRKDQYLAMLGHELRNPLAAIRNAAAVLAHDANGEDAKPARQALCEVVIRHVRHMGRLLEDLLDLSRLTQGKITVRLELCELGTIVARALENCSSLIEERCHRIDVSLPEEPVRLLGDPVRLVQVLVNLLQNSANYTAPGGSITLAARVAEGWLRLAVTDTGIGISPEVLPRIFEPFVQADQALERAQGGLGIGLTLVRGIIELHGGSVEAASRGAGLGTEMTLCMPVHDAVPGADGKHSDAEYPQSPRKRVLIVDDNRDAADSLALLLELFGHEVRSIGDGGESIEIAREFAPDLILMDIGLPGLDGYVAARELRARGYTARLTAVTGYGRPEDRQRAVEAGFDDFLVKPIDPQDVERLLHDPQ